jgi:hypothetical protein
METASTAFNNVDFIAHPEKEFGRAGQSAGPAFRASYNSWIESPPR